MILLISSYFSYDRFIMSNRNPRDRDNSNFKLPKLVNHQSERTATPHLQYLAGRVPKQEETTGQHSTRDPLFVHRSDTTRYDDFARNAREQSRDRGLRPLSRVGRQIQRTCQEDLRRRGKFVINNSAVVENVELFILSSKNSWVLAYSIIINTNVFVDLTAFYSYRLYLGNTERWYASFGS